MSQGKRRTRRRAGDPYRHPCPQCMAAPGKPCREYRGNVMGGAHHDRGRSPESKAKAQRPLTLADLFRAPPGEPPAGQQDAGPANG